MGFKFGTKSLSKLEGVHPDLVEIMKLAVSKSTIDFGISEGVRSKSRQALLVKSGASTTMNSKHIIQESTGFSHAVDMYTLVDGRACWELDTYALAGEAIVKSAKELGINNLSWGACWHIKDVAGCNMACSDMIQDYISTRSKQGRKIFMDAPHWQLDIN